MEVGVPHLAGTVMTTQRKKGKMHRHKYVIKAAHPVTVVDDWGGSSNQTYILRVCYKCDKIKSNRIHGEWTLNELLKP